MKLVYIMLLFAATATHAQEIKLIIKDEYQNPIPFVSVFDEGQNTMISSDSSGLVTLSEGAHNNILFTHVSFQTKQLNVGNIEGDTSLFIVLSYKNQGLEEIVIASKPSRRLKLNPKVFEAGYIVKRPDLYFNFTTKMKSKIASVITLNSHEPKNRYLKSVNFELSKGKKLKDDNFIIEIKIYAIKRDKVLPEPINTMPIYVQSKNLKNKNQIEITEDILLSYDKILISIELPTSERKGDAMITFIGNSNAEICSAYLGGDKENGWKEDMLSERCILSGLYPGTQQSVNIGIKYQFSE